MLLRRVQVVANGLRLLRLELAVVVLAWVSAVQRLLRLLLLQTLSITSEPGVMVLVSSLLLLLAVITLVRGLLLRLLGSLVLVGVTGSGSRLSGLCFRRSGGRHSLRLLQVLVLLVILLGEHSLLLTSKLVLCETAQLVGLIESSLTLAVDGLNREGGLLLGLRHLRGNGLNLDRLLRYGRLLRSDRELRCLDGRLGHRGGGGSRLSSFDLGRDLVFIQRLGGLSAWKLG